MVVASLAVIVLVHLFAPRLRFMSGVPRSRWLSAAGGASVAYVFVHLLPEIAAAQETLQARVAGPLAAIDRHAYVLALVGLAVFYGLERLTLRSREKQHATEDDHERESDQGEVKAEAPRATVGAFVVSTASFAVYNVLLGYILVASPRERGAQILYAAAVALHFVVNDFGLREHHKDLYDRYGRWILSLAITTGVAIGHLRRVDEGIVVAVLAFLAGGIVLNVVKEELPAERQSRFWAFAAGASAYGALLLAI